MVWIPNGLNLRSSVLAIARSFFLEESFRKIPPRKFLQEDSGCLIVRTPKSFWWEALTSRRPARVLQLDSQTASSPTSEFTAAARGQIGCLASSIILSSAKLSFFLGIFIQILIFIFVCWAESLCRESLPETLREVLNKKLLISRS